MVVGSVCVCLMCTCAASPSASPSPANLELLTLDMHFLVFLTQACLIHVGKVLGFGLALGQALHEQLGELLRAVWWMRMRVMVMSVRWGPHAC